MTLLNQNNLRETWATRVGVILAVTGSAVGLGNFLRFPGLAAEYGGGTFIVPYIVSLLLLGIPIALAEWGLGRYGGTRGCNSAPGIFRTVWRSRAASYMGVLGPVLPLIIYMYYVIVQAWCLGYAWMYLRGEIKAETEEEAGAVFANYIGYGADGDALRVTQTPVLAFAAVCFLINFALIYWGIRKGIELFCRIAMPALVICAIIVLIRVVTLPAPADAPHQTVVNGLGYMWNPVAQPEKLAPGDENVEALLEHAGDLPEVLLVLGRVYADLDRHEMALGAFERAYEQQQDYIFILPEMAEILLRNDEEDKAAQLLLRYEERLEKMVKMVKDTDETPDRTRLYLVDILSVVHDESAHQALKTALASDPVATIRAEAAVALGELGAFDARDTLQKAAVDDEAEAVRNAARHALERLREIEEAAPSP